MRQLSMTAPCLSVPTAIPYAMNPPKICAQPLKLNQIPVRYACSFFVYPKVDYQHRQKI